MRSAHRGGPNRHFSTAGAPAICGRARHRMSWRSDRITPVTVPWEARKRTALRHSSKLNAGACGPSPRDSTCTIWTRMSCRRADRDLARSTAGLPSHALRYGRRRGWPAGVVSRPRRIDAYRWMGQRRSTALVRYARSRPATASSDVRRCCMGRSPVVSRGRSPRIPWGE